MGQRGDNHHCKNGPRLWLKVRNYFAAPQSFTFACGDRYVRASSWSQEIPREGYALYHRKTRAASKQEGQR